MSLVAIIFLWRMARGTSGLGVRSRSVTGSRLSGGEAGPSALGSPWNSTTFMWAIVCNSKSSQSSRNQPDGPDLQVKSEIRTCMVLIFRGIYNEHLLLEPLLICVWQCPPAPILSPCFHTAWRGWCLCATSRSWTASAESLSSGLPADAGDRTSQASFLSFSCLNLNRLPVKQNWILSTVIYWNRSIWIKWGARLIRVLHPVDAVPVSQVRVPLLIVIAGVRRLMRVGGGGGVDWKTEVTPVMGTFQRRCSKIEPEFRGNALQKMEENSMLFCSKRSIDWLIILASSFLPVWFRATHRWCLQADPPSWIRTHRPQCRTPSVAAKEKLATPAFSWCTVTLSPHVCSVLKM